MLGVEGYGSDSDVEATTTTPAKPVTTKPTTTPNSASSPQPPKQAKRPKKITIDLPRPKKGDDGEDEPEQPPTKKARTDGKGAGVSSLLSMLPAPKQVAPAKPLQPERVLGGGNGTPLSFNSVPRSANDEPDTSVAKQSLFMPNSITRGKANVSTEDSPVGPPRLRAAPSPAIDFFSLGQSTSKPPTQQSKGLPTSLPSISSAPKIEEFVPPEPTPQDEHPGYYRLPSGNWMAYEREYYQKFYQKWQADYDKYVRDLEKGKVRGFEGLDEESAAGVNAMEEMAKAREEIQVKEERKALTQAKDQTAGPRMNVKGAALSGRARSRGQLATLLTEAYQNRETYEDKIAQGRRNRKEAGNKYGF